MKLKLIDGLDDIKQAVRNAAFRSHLEYQYNPKYEVTCKAKCNHCCSRRVVVTIAEALIIREYLIQKDLWKETLKRAKSKQELSAEIDTSTWFAMNIKCPILNEESGLCEAYEVRPPPCSTHLVSSDPSACDPWSSSSYSYQKIDTSPIIEEYDKVVSRVLSRSPLSFRLPIPNALVIAEIMAERKFEDFESYISAIGRDL